MAGNQPAIDTVDWSRIPAPRDDGGAAHLLGMRLPDLALPATNGTDVSLARLTGRAVVFIYPRTGTPEKIGLVDNWDQFLALAAAHHNPAPFAISIQISLRQVRTECLACRRRTRPTSRKPLHVCTCHSPFSRTMHFN